MGQMMWSNIIGSMYGQVGPFINHIFNGDRYKWFKLEKADHMCIQTRSQSFSSVSKKLSKTIINRKDQLQLVKRQCKEYTATSNVAAFFVCAFIYLCFTFLISCGSTLAVANATMGNVKLAYWGHIMEYAIYGCGQNTQTLQRIVAKYLTNNALPSCADAHRIIESAITFIIQITLGSLFGTATLQKLTPYIWHSLKLSILKTIGRHK